MPEIDIPLDEEIKKLIEMPDCVDLGLPEPQKLSIQLPSGGSIKALADISKGIPNDCSMTFSLALQLAPLLAAMDCIIKMLKLLKPLIDVVQGLPVPPVKAIQEFAKAAADLAPCLLMPTPASMIPFVRDILCLIIKMLRCFNGALKSLLGVMAGLQLKLEAAAGNPELSGALECAQGNSIITAQHLLGSLEPVFTLLEIAQPMMEIAGVKGITLPTIGDETDAESLQQVLKTTQGIEGTLQIVVDTIGGCPS